VIIFDMSNTVAGGFCAKLLGMKGDRVIWCEEKNISARALNPYSSTPALREYLRQNCNATEIDSADRSLVERTIKDADVVITGWDGGQRVYANDMNVGDVNPAAVEVVVSSFGTTGPYSQYRGGPAIDWAAGGYAYITGRPDRPPLTGPEHGCSYVTGYFASVAAELGLAMRNMGMDRLSFDVAAMDVMASVHQFSFSTFAGTGQILLRRQHASLAYPMDMFQCADGWVSVGVVTDAQYDSFVSAVEVMELLTDPRFSDARGRLEHCDEFDSLVRGWFMSHTRDEIVSTLQERQVPAVKSEDPHTITGNPQLRSRDYWQSYSVAGQEGIGPGDPIRIAITHERPPRLPQPEVSTDDILGSAGTSLASPPDLPLRGLVVADVTQYWAGPLCTRILADLGATVVMIERPGSRFHAHTIGPYSDWKMNRGKLSLAVDLKTAEGRHVVRDLASASRAVVENCRPGVMNKFGLGYETLSQDRTGFVYVSLSGFGQTGPQASWVSFGPLLEGASSIQSRTHYPGGPPTLLGHSLPDAVGGIAGVFALLNSLRQSELDGKCRHVDLSQLESYVAVSGEDIVSSSIGEYQDDVAAQKMYRCRGDDEWIVIQPETDSEVAALCDALRCDPATDLEAQIAERVREFDKQELTQLLQRIGVASFGVLNIADLANDRGLHERGFVVDVELAGKQVKMPGFPLHSSEPLACLDRGAPRAGVHTEAVLRRLLNYDDDRIEQLLSIGAVAQVKEEAV
jgi:crotonobetainyl-CoA:carnitine CoA-transferase CaiB-like acyl-CoA transferase